MHRINPCISQNGSKPKSLLGNFLKCLAQDNAVKIHKKYTGMPKRKKGKGGERKRQTTTPSP